MNYEEAIKELSLLTAEGFDATSAIEKDIKADIAALKLNVETIAKFNVELNNVVINLVKEIKDLKQSFQYPVDLRLGLATAPNIDGAMVGHGTPHKGRSE